MFCISLWVCVRVLGLMGDIPDCNSDEVACWSLFKHWPTPLTPLTQTCQCPRTNKAIKITDTHRNSPLAIITDDINDLTLCFLWPPKPLSWHSGGLLPSSVCVWLCSQQPHLLWVTLRTISPVLSKLLLTLYKCVLIACQQDVADTVAHAKSLTQPS